MLPKHDLSANPNLGPPDVENSSKSKNYLALTLILILTLNLTLTLTLAVEVRLEENSWKVLGNNLLNVFDTLYAHIKP
eukprot:1200047-Amorphochlora_amoeboformis.AAC.1